MAETMRLIAFGLAEAFLRGEWEVNALADRANSVLIPRPRDTWIKSLARRVIAEFGSQRPPLVTRLIQFIENDELFVQYGCDLLEYRDDLGCDVDLSGLPRPEMQPASRAASTWAVRPLVTVGEVADWLGLSGRELDWMADCRGQERHVPEGPLRHYRYRWIAKSSGGYRLLEIPKPRLKSIQRKILSDILNAIPPHPAAHAFRRGRSIVTSVAPHVGKRVVLRMDLRDFFPSVRASQVNAIFRTAGYPETVASTLTGLCTNTTPPQVQSISGVDVTQNLRSLRYGSPHLPQGSPTSPALANLAAFWLDCRLSGLAREMNAEYSRYADDLIFSGGREFARCLSRIRVQIAAIALHEGFEIRFRKTHTMLSGSRQQIGGIIVNQHPNIPRREYDSLRAILHNCCRYGPASQNVERRPHFRAHLLGRIAYWFNVCESRAAKLRSIFEKIEWTKTDF